MKRRILFKRFWPFPTSTTIAIIALAISLIQLLFTTPFLLEIYLKPRLIASPLTTNDQNNTLGTFIIKNEGHSTARNIEIGIISGELDKVWTVPDYGSVISDNGWPLMRTFRVTIPFLNSGESFNLLIERSPKSQDYIFAKSIGAKEIESKIGPFPSLVYLRCESGSGEIQSPCFEVAPVVSPMHQGNVSK